MKRFTWKGEKIESPFTDDQAAEILKEMLEINEFAGCLYLKYCQQKRGNCQLSSGQLFWLHKLAMQYFLADENQDGFKSEQVSYSTVEVKATSVKNKKVKSKRAKPEVVTDDSDSLVIVSVPAQNNPERLSNSPMPLVHSDLDDYGLTPHEFRVYAHIVRRTNGKPDGECFAKQELMASLCEMSVRRVQYALDVLVAAGMVTKCSRKGRTDVYQVAPKSNWVSSAQLAEIQKRQKQTKESI